MITGKVAKIIDNRTVAINVGTKDGVKIGMQFRIIDGVGHKVKDPDTNKVLGIERSEKFKVRVAKVDKAFSIAETYYYTERNIGGRGSFGNFAQMLTPPNYVKEYETFDMDEGTKKEISEEKSRVKVGDIVEEVLEKPSKK